jgi:hypothetical protein
MTFHYTDVQIALQRHRIPPQEYDAALSRKRRELLSEVRAVDARKGELMELVSSLLARSSLSEMARPLIDMTHMQGLPNPNRLGMPNLVELERALAVRRAELALAEFRIAREWPAAFGH